MTKKRPIWKVTVRGEFSASHQLRHYQGKCEAMHGHNFHVEVSLEGERLDEKTGILMDFREIKGMLRDVLAEFDHAHLNDLPAFARCNPSSEFLAQYIHRSMSARLEGRSVRMSEVSVSEKSSQTATYREA